MRRLGSLVGISAAAAALISLHTPSALAAPPEDFDGNVTTCAQAIAAGADFVGVDLQAVDGEPEEGDIVEGTISLDGTMLDVVLLDDAWTITAVIVKGGDAYRVYTEPPWEDLVSPLNDGGQIPEISHWFACGVQTEPTEPPTEPTEPPTEPTQPPTEEPTEPTEEPTEPTEEPTEPTEEPSPSASPTAPVRELPDTGATVPLALLIGVAALGAGALAIRRRFVS